MWDGIPAAQATDKEAWTEVHASARFTGLGLQVGRPLRAGSKARRPARPFQRPFSRPALAMTESRKKFRPVSPRARAADSPTFLLHYLNEVVTVKPHPSEEEIEFRVRLNEGP